MNNPVILWAIIFVAVGLGFAFGWLYWRREMHRQLDAFERTARTMLPDYFDATRDGSIAPIGPPSREMMSLIDGGKYETRVSMFRTLLWHIYMRHDVDE